MNPRVFVGIGALAFVYAVIVAFVLLPDSEEPYVGPPQEEEVPTLPEQEMPVRIDPGQGKVKVDIFREFRSPSEDNRRTAIAKYKDKQFMLFGTAIQRYGCDGKDFIRCAGFNHEGFWIIIDDRADYDRIRINYRVLAQGVLDESWAADHFGTDTVWKCRLLQLQEPTPPAANVFRLPGWKTIWRAKQGAP